MTLKYDIAILGATGVVGEALLEILEKRQFPVGRLYLLASEKSAGNTLQFKNKPFVLEDAETFDFSKVQICFCAVHADIAERIVPRAANSGCVVIDKSSRFRYEPNVPLLIPEVNPEALEYYRESNIIAVPNCSTIPILVALKPIYDAVGVSRINIATYQSVSGAGKNGIEELNQQVKELLNMMDPQVKHFPVPIAFNLIPQIDDFLENEYTKEEMKIVWETQKILNDIEIQVNPTAVRVPVFYGHSAAVHLETRDKISKQMAKDLLISAPGIIVMDELEAGGYPTPLTVAEKEDAVFVGRIREDISHPQGLNFWVVADNVRKGAALNAIQIAELLIRDYL
jgi:aspartate-semialdehyde dehydrogenase